MAGGLQESSYVEPGQRLPSPVPSPVGKLGLGVCYDLRFPEHSQALAAAGAEVEHITRTLPQHSRFLVLALR